MTNKLTDLAAVLPDKVRTPRPKTPEQLGYLIDQLTYEQQVQLYEVFKSNLDILTRERISAAKIAVDELEQFKAKLNGE